MIVSELIEQLLECDLDSTVTVFFDRYDYEQGEENPVVIVDGGFVLITAKSDEQTATWWVIQ